MSDVERRKNDRRKGECRRKQSIPVEKERRIAPDRRTDQDRRKN